MISSLFRAKRFHGEGGTTDEQVKEAKSIHHLLEEMWFRQKKEKNSTIPKRN